MRTFLLGAIFVVLVLMFLKSCADSAQQQQQREDEARLELLKDMSEFQNRVNDAWNRL